MNPLILVSLAVGLAIIAVVVFIVIILWSAAIGGPVEVRLQC